MVLPGYHFVICSQVFLKAMAETGQVKLYGEHPTRTETALYRARRHLFKEERYQENIHGDLLIF